MDNLINYKNYYVYAEAVRTHSTRFTIYVPESISMENIDDHINGISSILKDGIETDYVHNLFINVTWGGDVEADLNIIDYWYSLFMWYMILRDGEEIKPQHIFWNRELKRNSIKSFIDKYVANTANKIRIPNIELNNTICDGIGNFSKLEEFSYYLANTINNEDDILLMNNNKEYYDILHCSLAGIPFDEVKDAGMKLTDRAIEIIKDSKRFIGYEHGLTNSFRASEAINPRQFKEVRINIGTKPSSDGVYPYIIDKSFSNGGVNDPLSYFIESSTARAAQIMSKTNVGESGDFARLLGINNTDTILNHNSSYACLSRNFIKYEIKTKKHLIMIKNRYYRFNPLGMEYMINETDESLIGKTIYMKSPMTCASNSDGMGICRKCYGELYWTNLDINIGKIAAEILSSQLTQTLLSAKHLLETKIQKIVWNDEFSDFFDIDINSIKLSSNLDSLKGYTLIIDPDDISLVNEEDTSSSNYDDEEPVELDDEIYNEYITSFIIETPTGSSITFASKNEVPDALYISNELNKIIRKKAYNKEDKIAVPLTALEDIILFFVKINNNEISKTMNMIINLINKSEVTKNKTKDEALQTIVDLVVEGNLTIDSVHLEVILSNQICKIDDPLTKPNWNDPNALYRMCTLNEALKNNPSVLITLLYKDLHRTLYNPLTFSKRGASFMDVFYMEKPQEYMSDKLLADSNDIKDPEKSIVLARRIKE